MKMHGIIVKQDFAVVVAFYYICSFKNPVITISKVVGCEDCVEENKLPLWAPGGEAPNRWKILEIFFGKNSDFNAIWMTLLMF